MLQNIVSCMKCNLSRNQKPLLDNTQTGNAIWVGLSAVKVTNVASEVPLGETTNTGKLIGRIEKFCSSISFYRTNLVKCLPLRNGRIRYPSRAEMHCCYPHLLKEMELLRPSVVFLLGRQVSEFVLSRFKSAQGSLDRHLAGDFNYRFCTIENIPFVPIHHPSYILIYKRRMLNKYIEEVSRRALHLCKPRVSLKKMKNRREKADNKR